MEMKRANLKLRQLKDLGGEGGEVPLIAKCMWFKNYPLMNSKTVTDAKRGALPHHHWVLIFLAPGFPQLER